VEPVRGKGPSRGRGFREGQTWYDRALRATLYVYRLPRAASPIALMMEAVQTPETLVNSYQSTRRYNPEGSRLHGPTRQEAQIEVARCLKHKRPPRNVTLYSRSVRNFYSKYF
jgi:hypothetical protein